jgi:hypothetical protein
MGNYTLPGYLIPALSGNGDFYRLLADDSDPENVTWGIQKVTPSVAPPTGRVVPVAPSADQQTLYGDVSEFGTGNICNLDVVTMSMVRNQFGQPTTSAGSVLRPASVEAIVTAGVFTLYPQKGMFVKITFKKPGGTPYRVYEFQITPDDTKNIKDCVI